MELKPTYNCGGPHCRRSSPSAFSSGFHSLSGAATATFGPRLPRSWSPTTNTASVQPDKEKLMQTFLEVAWRILMDFEDRYHVWKGMLKYIPNWGMLDSYGLRLDELPLYGAGFRLFSSHDPHGEQMTSCHD